MQTICSLRGGGLMRIPRKVLCRVLWCYSPREVAFFLSYLYSLLRYILNHIPSHSKSNHGPLATVSSVEESELSGRPAWCRHTGTTVDWKGDLPKAGTETSDGVRKARSLGQLTCETDVPTLGPWFSGIPDTPEFIVSPFLFFFPFLFSLSLFLLPFFLSFIYLTNTCWNLCPGRV